MDQTWNCSHETMDMKYLLDLLLKTTKDQPSSNIRNSWVIRTLRHISYESGWNCKSLQKKFKEEAQKELKNDPFVLEAILYKAAISHSSPYFIEVIQELAETYRTLPNKLQVGPLQRLVWTCLWNYSQELLPFVEILLTVDDSQDTRAECLQVLIRNLANGQLEWNEQYIRILRILKEGANPEWIPFLGFDQCDVYSFQRIIHKVILKDNALQFISELLPVFLTRNAMKHQESLGSVLHALVNIDWKELTSSSRKTGVSIATLLERYQLIISKVVEKKPQLIDLSDKAGRLPLHCFIKGINSHEEIYVQDDTLQSFCSIFRVLKSDQNINAKDHCGQTVLHYLAEAFPVHVELKLLCSDSLLPAQGHEIFDELVQCLVSPTNMSVQDENGCTALHIIVKKVFHSPGLVNSLLASLPMLTSTENINVMDVKSLTPNSWIIGAKVFNRETFQSIFAKIEDLFLSKGARMDPAGNDLLFKKYCALIGMLKYTRTPEGLDRNADEIVHLLNKNGSLFLQRHEPVLLVIVQLAIYCIESLQYIRVIQAVADLCKTAPGKHTQGLLKPLLKYINDAHNFTSLRKYSMDLPSVLKTVPFTHVNQSNLLTIVKTLMAVESDDQLQSRTECLRALVMNAKHTSGQKNAGWISWTPKFVLLLQELLNSGADPTWIPEGSEESSLYKFFQAIFNVLANEPQMEDSLLELLSMFLNEQSVKHEECQGNVLHALVEGALEWLPDQMPQRHFKEIVSKITEHNPATLDVVNIDGRTPLQCLLYAIIECKSLFKNVGDIIKILKTETNINIQDRLGRNALHWLMEILPFYPDCDVSQNHQTFCHLVSQIKTSESVNAQDQDGRTPLHTVARAVCLFPNTAYDLLDTISNVATTSNVNAVDNDSLTPCSWILSLKIIHDKQGRVPNLPFARIYQIFLNNGMDAAVARPGVHYIRLLGLDKEMEELETDAPPDTMFEEPDREMYPQLMGIDEVMTANDLDSLGHRFCQTLLFNGHGILRKEPKHMIKMVEKAKNLMASRFYLKIVKIMADIYKSVPGKPKTGSFDVLVKEMQFGCRELLFVDQDAFLLLTRILSAAETSPQSRREYLAAIIENFEYVSSLKDSLRCTSEFMSTLKFLLKKGEDPIGLSNSDSGSSRYKFFRTFNCILANQGHLFNQLLDLIPLFFTEKSLGANRETMLHGLVSCEWLQITRHLTEEFFQHFKQIVIEVIDMDPSATDAIDKGKNPLQCFLSEVRAQFQDVSHMIDIAKLLKTDTNVDVQDNEGRTALHHLCQALCLETYQDVSQNQHEMILSLISLIKSAKNVNIQDEHGETPLHMVARQTFLSANPTLNVCPVFEILATKENVNIVCKDSITLSASKFSAVLMDRTKECGNNDQEVTPHGWILRGKMVHEKINADALAVFSAIEEIFAKYQACGPVVKPEIGSTLPVWITLSKSHTLDRLRTLKEHMDSEEDWFFHSDIWAMSIFPLMLYGRNPKSVEISKDIFTSLLSKGCNCASNYIFGELNCAHYDRKDVYMEMLLHCITKGAVLTQSVLNMLLDQRQSITKNGKHMMALLKVLVSFSEDKALTFDGFKEHNMLDFLTYCYYFCEELRQLAMEFVQNVYDSGEQLERVQRIYGNPEADNTFQRSPFHFAVIFLDDEITLKSLSHDVIKQGINARDLHGCTPLHLAQLHHNKQAIRFLIEHGAENDVVDNFGMTPEDLGSRPGIVSRNGMLETVHYSHKENCTGEDHVDVVHYKHCCSVACHPDVLKQLRPMVVVLQDGVDSLIDELKLLFKRLVDIAGYDQAEVFIAGSVREKLKVGRLDEVDVQIRFNKIAWPASEGVYVDERPHVKPVGDFRHNWSCIEFQRNLLIRFLGGMSRISWKGIHLRPLYVAWENPWEFLIEGNGSFSGVTMHVDVVFVLLHEVQEDTVLEQQLGHILEEAPMHHRRSYTPLKHFDATTSFSESTFALEWDIIDSLPTSHRLALAISKALVQAYDWNSMQHTKMPITSYVLKTTLFFILAGRSEDSMISKALKYALESKDQTDDMKQTDFMKLKFNPHPRWITNEDVDQFAEDARRIALTIFRFIHYLAMHGWKVKTYWRKPRLVDEQDHIGETEYICEICEILLDRLNARTFNK